MPATPRIVTGNIATLTGEAREGIVIAFIRTGAGDVFGQYGDVVVNEPAKATSGEDGAFSVTLYPGTYGVRAAGSNGPKSAVMSLTEDGSTDFADLIGQASAPITSTEVADARAARDAAEAARDAALQAETNAEAAEGAAEAAQVAAESARDTATGAATTATTQAGVATTQSGIATTQAGIATTQAGLASTARTGAETAETNAETAQAAAEAARDLADADAIATAADRTQTGIDRAAAEAANAQAQEASGIHSAVAEQVGTLAAAFGQAYEVVSTLADAQDNNTVNTAALMALAQMIGQIADQINGGRVTLAGGTLADPALRIGTVGIYSAATNTLSVAIAGVERLRVTTDGITVFGNITDA